MKANRKLSKKLVPLLLLVVLASLATACGSAGTYVDVNIDIPYTRWISGYVYDYEYGDPVDGARITVENSWDDTLYQGYSDFDGYFEIYVEEWYDREDVLFRVHRISHSDYDSYFSDDIWYSFYDEIVIYTGEYYLDPYYW